MLRGVKKQIIEVLNTENEYFEKAILVVSERFIECDRALLNRKAKEYVSSVTPSDLQPEQEKSKHSDRVGRLFSVFKYFIFAAVGAVVMYFLIK